MSRQTLRIFMGASMALMGYYYNVTPKSIYFFSELSGQSGTIRWWGRPPGRAPLVGTDCFGRCSEKRTQTSIAPGAYTPESKRNSIC